MPRTRDMTLALGDLLPSNLDVVSCRNHGNGPLRPCLDNSRFFVKRSWLQRRPQSPVHYFITSVEILESMRACLCRSEDIAEVLTRLLALRDTVAGSKDRRVSLLRSIRAVSGQCQQPLRTRRSRGPPRQYVDQYVRIGLGRFELFSPCTPSLVRLQC
jgi:hypothetical protein